MENEIINLKNPYKVAYLKFRGFDYTTNEDPETGKLNFCFEDTEATREALRDYWRSGDLEAFTSELVKVNTTIRKYKKSKYEEGAIEG